MEGQRLGRVAFVYRNKFIPQTFYYRYDIVELYGNLYHCTNLAKRAYSTIEVDEAAKPKGESAKYWELFLKGTGGYSLIAGSGIEATKDDDGNWKIVNVMSVESNKADGCPIDVKTIKESGNKVKYQLNCKGVQYTGEGVNVDATNKKITWKTDTSKNENIEVKQQSNGAWTFKAKGGITPAVWEKWWIKYPWDVNTNPTVEYPMPLYVSAAGMNVVGYCCDQESGGGNLGYITDSGYSFARYATSDNGNVHPIVIVNPTKQYVTVRRTNNNLYVHTDGKPHTVDLKDYFTKQEVDDYLAQTTHTLHQNSYTGATRDVSGDVQVYQVGSDDKYVIYQEWPEKIASYSIYQQRTCWECVSDSVNSNGLCNWHYSADGEYSDKCFTQLHGPDNKLIGYIKWGSGFTTTWGGSDVLYLHWHNYYNQTTNLQNPATCTWDQPGITSTESGYIYNYSVNDGTFTYTSTGKKTPVTDRWYAIVSGIIPNTTNGTAFLLEITDENDEIRQEHKGAFESASAQRSCSKKGSEYIFTITVGTQPVTWSCDEATINNYFTVKKDASGEITEISVANKNALIAAHSDCLYTPTSNVCVDCDKPLKTKSTFNQNNPICVPLYSGCTFVNV